MSPSGCPHPSILPLLLHSQMLLDFKRKEKLCSSRLCICVRTGSGPPVTGSGLPRGGRKRRLQCPANPRHARHSLPLLPFQLPLGPEPVATATQAGVCRSDEFQSRSSVDEGALGLLLKCCIWLTQRDS